jgi:hypothetical protein
VSGHVIAIEPKVGRRTGPFELLTFALELVQDDAVVTRVTFAWALPGSGSAA